MALLYWFVEITLPNVQKYQCFIFYMLVRYSVWLLVFLEIGRTSLGTACLLACLLNCLFAGGSAGWLAGWLACLPPCQPPCPLACWLVDYFDCLLACVRACLPVPCLRSVVSEKNTIVIILFFWPNAAQPSGTVPFPSTPSQASKATGKGQRHEGGKE